MIADAAGTDPPVHSSGVLADRIAAALVHREPGWRLPRRSALARRYNVSLSEIDLAIRDLAGRSLVRRLPDGQLYRASPADYWIPVEGATGLGTRLDPMGSSMECHARHVALREAPQDVAWAIEVPVGAPVQVVRCVWTLGGDPAAISTTYLPGSVIDEQPANQDADEQDGDFGAVLETLPGLAARPTSVSVEMCPPQPSVARSLRLSPGQPVTIVTVRFEDREHNGPAGLTVLMLRPELFRVAIDTTEAPTQKLVTAWTRTGRCWHPSANMPAEVGDGGSAHVTARPLSRPARSPAPR
jgi:GntR family transcriptional regulator